MKRMLAISLLALFLVGCAAQETAYQPTGDALIYDEDYTGPVATRPQQESDQELTLTYYPDQSMHPYEATDFTNRALFSLIYQSLFTVDRDYNIEPMLCKQYSVSQDMRTYTFYLENATFSDGSRLTATDVVESLLAAKESTVYGGRLRYVQEVTASGNAVVVQLSTAYENFPLLLDIPIVKASQLENPSPMGTGPYVFTANSLRRRNDWWCNAQMQVTAPVIKLVRAESATQIRDQFEFSDLSLVCADPGSDRYADYRCDYELWDCENNIFLYLSFYKESTVFSDPEVRSAVTYAVDRAMLVSDYYRGFARSATLPASPQFPHYSQVLASKYEYDPQRFAQVISDKGLKDSPVILLVNSGDSLRVRVARAIAQMLNEGGLNVEVRALSAEACKQALLYRNFDIYLGQTKLSPNMDLSPFFYVDGALSYGGVNDVAAYSLCLQALENHGNYYTLHQTVMENGLLCPILFRSYSIYATRGLLTGLTPARDNIFYYSLGKTMEQALRAQ